MPPLLPFLSPHRPPRRTCRKTAAQPAKAKGIWIDVRTPEEFKEGHLKDAVNIPVDQIGARIGSVSPDKSAPVNLYCRSGRRSEAALQELKKNGLYQRNQPRRLPRPAAKRVEMMCSGRLKKFRRPVCQKPDTNFGGIQMKMPRTC